MKFELTDQDKQSIISVDEHNRIISFLQNKDNFTFKIGDIINKLTKGWASDAPWVVEKISSVSDASRKYVYAFENDVGVGYIKPILKDGSLGTEIYCMANMDTFNSRFQLDPEYVDHMLLADDGEELDLTASYERSKKIRDKAYKANKELCLHLPTPLDEVKFLDSVKVGDTFWMGTTIDDMAANQYEVTKVDQPHHRSGTYEYERRKWEDLVQSEPIIKALNLRMKVVDMKCIKSSDEYRLDTIFTYSYGVMPRFIARKTPFPMTENT